MRAIKINVYRDTAGDCSNGGITSCYSSLFLLCDEGNYELSEEHPPENLVKLVTRYIGGGKYQHLEPVARCDKGCAGWMNGGTIAYSSDSRFRKMSQYPLCVHDRQENMAEYNSMFH